MSNSMPREQARRYAEAFHYAIVDRDVTFQLGDEFAGTRGGWMFHKSVGDAWLNRSRRRSRAPRTTTTAQPVASPSTVV
jgi:hypothetical protein